MNTVTRHHASTRALLLWVALLVLGQTAGLAHQHVDEAPGASCAICSLSEAQTAACDRPAASPPAPVGAPAAAPTDPLARMASLSHPFQARAPPLI